jgi:hypothetical protein
VGPVVVGEVGARVVGVELGEAVVGELVTGVAVGADVGLLVLGDMLGCSDGLAVGALVGGGTARSSSKAVESEKKSINKLIKINNKPTKNPQLTRATTSTLHSCGVTFISLQH